MEPTRGLSGSPPAIAPSKRDKRRSIIADKLNGLTATFSEHRDQHYRSQVQAIQIDMSLILNAMPYSDAPLPDSPEEIAELVNATTGGSMPAGFDVNNGEAGKRYAKFADETNDALEERDSALVMLLEHYKNSLSELNQTYNYKIRLAHEEHRLLSNTVRERLIAAVLQKRSRLLREKEQLDLADSNALLLHPNQFSLTNPLSPGGAQSNRKTRHTRHRMEQEDIPNAVSAQENKRKRKSGFNETETGSPGPSGRGLEARIGSPFRDAKARLTHTQYEAPLFSLDRLFTEKELTLVMNQAHMAATHFFTKPRTLDRRGNGGGSGGSASAAAASAAAAAAIATASTTASTTVADVVMGDATEPEEPLFDTGLPAIGKPDLIDDDSSLAAAVDMDRTASASQMTTRGASRNNANAAAVAAAAAAAAVAAADAVRSAEQSLPFPSTSTVQPIILPANMSSRSNAAAPAPPALVTADVDYDLILMGRSATVNAAINAKLLDRACGPLIARQYEFRPPTMQLDSGGGAATATASLSAVAAAAAATNAYSNPLIVTPQASAVGIGGVPMSAQSSTGGISDAGGVAMSRHGNGSSIGAIGMKRSASARGRS